MQQMASHCKIPMAYIDTMNMASAGALLARNLEYWFTQRSTKRLLAHACIGCR